MFITHPAPYLLHVHACRSVPRQHVARWLQMLTSRLHNRLENISDSLLQSARHSCRRRSLRWSIGTRFPRAQDRLAASASVRCKSSIVSLIPVAVQLEIMGKMKKAGINEKAVDARAAKEMAKTSKQEKESKQKEDADWAAAGEGTQSCFTLHAVLVHLPFA